MEAGLYKCVNEAVINILGELELQNVIRPGEEFDIKRLYSDDDAYLEMWVSTASYWLGYLEGMADFSNTSVHQILDEYNAFEPEEKEEIDP